LKLKGVILAGGTGSRLWPLTKVTNKHLLAVGKQPMLYYPLQKLITAGIEEVLIVTGVEHMGDVVNLLGSGKEFNCRLTYKVQDEAGGIAQALSLAENFAGGAPVVVILGDNIFEASLASYVQAYMTKGGGAMVLLKQVHDPHRFGVAEVLGGKVIGIEEKPKAPKSELAVTGVYFYDSRVYDIIRTLRPSGRGELEITDVNNAYIKLGCLHCDKLEGWWSDAGTFESLAKVNELVFRTPPK
jgi:glucose-1-phosphate thymidylyltransferase